MTPKEAVNWIINITADIGKIEHQDLWHYEQALSEIRKMLEDAPTIEPERNKGEWLPIIDSDENGEPYQAGVYCSECGFMSCCEDNYCPNCGAEMKGEQEWTNEK